jgi:hypothetical protein
MKGYGISVHWMSVLIAACAATLLAGCGGGEGATSAPRAMTKLGNIGADRSAAASSSISSTATTATVSAAAEEVSTAALIPAGKLVLGYYSGYSNNYS